MLSMAIIGLRDVTPSLDLFPIKKLFCTFDISGDSKDSVKTNKHAVIKGSCNVFEIVSIEVDVPKDIQYAPVLTVYVYDQLMGILGKRLVGVANIPLDRYCKKVMERYYNTATAFMGGTIEVDRIRLQIDNKEEKKITK